MRSLKTLFTLLAVASPTLLIAGQEEIAERFRATFKGKVEVVSATPIGNGALYQVLLSNGKLISSTSDGKYFAEGDLWSIADLNPINLTKDANIKRVKALNEDDLIVFPASNEKYKITVFTDTSCSYCRKLHSEIEELNDVGITVQYAAFPRGGRQSQSFDVMQSVWCSDDPNKAISNAKRDISVPPSSCVNPVEQHYELGLSIGVKGTPTIVTDRDIISGYRDPDTLLWMLSHEAE